MSVVNQTARPAAGFLSAAGLPTFGTMRVSVFAGLLVVMAACAPASRGSLGDPDSGISSNDGPVSTFDAGEDAGSTLDGGILGGGADAAVDAGTQPDASTPIDAGPQDAGVPTTILHTDAGVDIILYEYDDPGDCAGLVPNVEDFQPVSLSLTPDAGESCPPPMTDESGVIALGAGGKPPIGKYLLVTNDMDAGAIGPFTPGMPFKKLHGEPSGFSAVLEDNLAPGGTFEPGDAGWSFFAYDQRGAIVASARRELTSSDSSAETPLPGGGYALVVGNAQEQVFTLQRFTPDAGWQLSDPVPIDVAADGGMPLLLAVPDQEGDLFVQYGWFFDQYDCPNRWYDRDGHRIGDCILAYEWPLGEIRTMLGEISLQHDNDEPPDFYRIIPDPSATPSAKPDMVRQWAIIRHGNAYANWGEHCIGDFCKFAPGSMDLLSRSGKQCATLFFRDTSIFVSRDGTVIEQTACSYRWFPQLLR